ncbi:hypothetical protein MKZ38_004532 [Zalerion maritima]|uniref:Rhodopsin domain-containing protein n=1 Tax=Zalerion maritima TaxID=339359 RepID=A0AAD5RM12_9PEZI|nr:hypothetical protein MKZ38_004532 [Zalerion maritima]
MADEAEEGNVGLDFEANLGPKSTAVVWGLSIAALVFLILRVYCKFRMSRGLWWDDWVMIAAWILLLADCILQSYTTSLGFGHHVYAIDEDILPKLGLALNFSGTFIVLAAAWSKTSFAITLLRVSTGWLKHLIWFLIATINLFMILSAIFRWNSCKPIEKSFDRTIEGTCWPEKPLLYYDIFSSAYSATADIVLALLPWQLIFSLQMRTKEKVGVALAMSMGLFAGATAIVKCAQLPTLADGDFTYTGTSLIMWGAAEPAVAIMAGSIPVLRVLIKEAHSSAKKYRQTSQERQTNIMGTSRRHEPNTVVVTASRSSVLRKPGGDGDSATGDDRSEKSILGAGKILRTDAVAVEYHDRRDIEDGYEMQDIAGSRFDNSNQGRD